MQVCEEITRRDYKARGVVEEDSERKEGVVDIGKVIESEKNEKGCRNYPLSHRSCSRIPRYFLSQRDAESCVRGDRKSDANTTATINSTNAHTTSFSFH